MPRMIDVKCPQCEQILIDLFLRPGEDGEYTLPDCDVCHTAYERVFLPTGRQNVIGDDVPGGLYIKNALCHSDGTPRRFDSKSAMHAFAKKRGWTNEVHHIGVHSDKNKNTQKFI
jgi:hypothetical protein